MGEIINRLIQKIVGFNQMKGLDRNLKKLPRYSSIKPSAWALDSAIDVASQICCDSNAGDESETLLDIELRAIQILTDESAQALFANQLKGYDNPVRVYCIEWTAWICRQKFCIDDPWSVRQSVDCLFIVEDELRNADFNNYGMGCEGRYLEWSQKNWETFDASIESNVPNHVVDGLLELVPNWGFEVDEWFGGYDERPSAKHPLLLNMLPRFRKVVMATIRGSRQK